jgi:phosphoribulokinase
MSQQHPIVAVTGASGAGTTVVKGTFSIIFRREGIKAAFVGSEDFRRYDRREMRAMLAAAEAEGKSLSPYGPDVNRFELLEETFRQYSETGGGRIRRYITHEIAGQTGQPEGVFGDWEELPADSDLLFYEGLHGGVVASRWSRRKMSSSHNPRVVIERRKAGNSAGVDVAQHVDLLLGVVPVVNLEWMQKIRSDMALRGYSDHEVAQRIVHRMEDYINFITPQFSVTDINFQRIPVVDTSNPFIAAELPTDSECMVVIRFRDPQRYNFPDILKRIDGSAMSRPNSMVIPGGSMKQAIDVICTPLILDLVDGARAVRQQAAGR